MIIFLKKSTIYILLSLLLGVAVARAEDGNFPEPMVGWLTVEKDGHVYHDGMGANEVILNHDANELLGFDKARLEECSLKISTDPYNLPVSGTAIKCFMLNIPSYDSLLMTSRTYRDDVPDVEISALIYDRMISGDVYGLNQNFALYGRNLKIKSPSVTNDTWNAGDSYTLNDEAQSSYKDSKYSKDYFERHIDDLNGEAKVMRAANLDSAAHWYLQSESNTIANSDNYWKMTRPEGGLWRVNGDLTINNAHTFHDLGTLVVNGNLIINDNIKESSSSSTLGIIVTGNVTINSGSTVRAAIFSLGSMTLQKNVSLTGSFMANSFVTAGNSGIRIAYDPNLEANWPPGFRYFNMPQAKSARP